MANNFNVAGKLVITSQEAMTLPRLSSAPGSPVNGDAFYDTTLNVVRVYENGAWATLADFTSLASQANGASGASKIGIDITPAFSNFTSGNTVQSALEGIDSALTTAGGTSFSDAVFEIYDDAAPTKKFVFQASGITAGQTRTISVPDANVDLGALTNSNISASAAIAYSKLAALTTSRVLQSNASTGFVEVSSVTNTELSYLSGVTSSIQTQLGTKVVANTAITGATKTKITYDAKGLVTAGADATTADIAASTDKNYVTDAQLVVIGNTSGTNTGDQSASTVANTPAGNIAAITVQAAINELDSEKAPIASPTFTGTVSGITATMVGLGNVTNDAQLKAADLDTDVTLAADSATKIPSQHAVKNYVDTKDALNVLKAGSTMTGALTMSGANIVMGSNKITGLANGTSANDAVNKSQLDGVSAGLLWINPIQDPDLIDANKMTDPGFGTVVPGDVYIAGANDGAFTAGYAYFSTGSAWVDLLGRAVQSGDRFGVSMESATSPVGILSTHADKIVVIDVATPGSVTILTPSAPASPEAVYVNAPNSSHFGHQYTYSGTAWIEFGGTSALIGGTGLLLTGNTLSVNMGAGIATLPSDEVGVDVHASGGLFTTVDNSLSSTATGAQLAIQLDGSTLAKGVGGLKVATGGIANNEIASGAAIAYSKLAALTSANILVGSAGNVATSVAVTGDVTISNAGVTAIGSSKVTSAMLAGSIDATKIADGSVTSTEFQYINSLSSNAQDQIDNKVTKNSAITGAVKTKITYDAKGLVTAGADATTADIAASTNKNYVTDTDLTHLSNLSGTNTGDQTATTVANTPAGNIAAVTVQAALNELDSEKATLALDNLASVALNASLVPGTDNSIALGSSAKRFNNAYVNSSVKIGAAALQLSMNAPVTTTLAANQASYATAFTLFAHASQKSSEVMYEVNDGTEYRSGRIMVATNGSTVGYSDTYSETAPISSLAFQVIISGANVVLQFIGTGASACTINIVQRSIV